MSGVCSFYFKKKVCSRKIHSVDCANNFKRTPKTRHVSAGFLNHNW